MANIKFHINVRCYYYYYYYYFYLYFYYHRGGILAIKTLKLPQAGTSDYSLLGPLWTLSLAKMTTKPHKKILLHMGKLRA